jgi:hypothetical protein
MTIKCTGDLHVNLFCALMRFVKIGAGKAALLSRCSTKLHIHVYRGTSRHFDNEQHVHKSCALRHRV